MTESNLGLAEVTEDTQRLGGELVAAIKKAPEGVLEGDNLARLMPIWLAAEEFQDRYVGVGGWTRDSEAIEISKTYAVGDNIKWFDPASGERMGQ